MEGLKLLPPVPTYVRKVLKVLPSTEVPRAYSPNGHNLLRDIPLAPRSPRVHTSIIENSSPNATARKTYIYLGHGGEVSLTDNAVVPQNCTLSTISESGINSYISNMLQLCNTIATHKNTVLNPTKPSNFKKLSKLFHGKQNDKTYFRHKLRLLEGM